MTLHKLSINVYFLRWPYGNYTMAIESLRYYMILRPPPDSRVKEHVLNDKTLVDTGPRI